MGQGKMHAIVGHSFVRCTILILGENTSMSIGLPTICKKIVSQFLYMGNILPSRFFFESDVTYVSPENSY